MGELLVALIPYGLAAALAAPASAIVSALVLGQAKRAILSASMFVLGAFILDGLVAVVILSLMEASGQFTDGADIAAWVDALLGVIFVGIGISAVFQTESPEKSAAQRARIEGLISSGYKKLFVLGVIVAIVNSDSLAVMSGGLKEIAISDVAAGAVAVALVWLLLLVLLPYYVPILMVAVSPKRSTALLKRFGDWLLGHSRMLEIVTGLVLGGLFLWKGLAALV
jgi:threonine/homoserine/homoserine lactone efflux protein